MPSKDSLSTGWSKRMAALKLSRNSFYISGSNGVLGFLDVLWGVTHTDLDLLVPVGG
jgi:hypothetical protein